MKLNPHFQSIENLSSSYFSLVMATGIVSIAAQLFNYTFVSIPLFYISIVSFVILVILFVTRLLFYPKNFISDFVHPSKNPGFLTFVAASSMLGIQFIDIVHNYQIAYYFLITGIISWVFLIYAFFTLITIKRNKPTLAEAISGTWLLVIVSTQSIAILAVRLLYHVPLFITSLLFFSLVMFMLGCVFYFIIITLIVYRLSFFELTTDGFAPPYWINMGAAAISALAGSTLILSIEKAHIFLPLISFIKGFTVMFWSFATWWIPLMIILGIWRHLIKHLPFKYLPQYWGMIFPLGIYTVCTAKLSQAIELPFLTGVSSVFVFFAIGAWAIVFIGLVYAIIFNNIIKKSLKNR
jgi:tellurite resistance protein TehA-like permease